MEPCVWQVASAMWVNVADNSSMYTLQQWAPVWFLEVLHCSPAQAGGYLAVANAVNVAGQFISAAVETALLRSGPSHTRHTVALPTPPPPPLLQV